MATMDYETENGRYDGKDASSTGPTTLSIYFMTCINGY